MQIQDIQPKKQNKNPKPRVGRGGKRGYTSGRGAKGQRSRSGHKIRPAIRDLIQRLPKLRGYKNNPKSDSAVVFGLTDLEKFEGAEFSKDTLVKSGLIKNKGVKVKVLANGEIKKKMLVKEVLVSAVAKKSIEEAGGSVE